ncbi:MAG TPA: hypothetical protein VGE37_03190, partial [Archangium sp.]
GKKEKRTPVHLFLEEAQVFVPQRVQPDEARMLGAFEDLVKLGRNFGIGVTLISQRPQSVNKDALNQTECLVVLQTNGAQERKALKDWIVEVGIDVGTDLIATLPGLERGEAWVWSPSWLRLTKRVRIAKKRTLNASATPELGAVVEAKPLAPIDLQHLREAMAETMKAAEASDPKLLQKRIVELERQLAAKPAPAKVETKVVEKAVITEAQLKRIETVAQGALAKALDQLSEALRPVVTGLAAVHKAPGFPPPKPLPPALATVQARAKWDQDWSTHEVTKDDASGTPRTFGKCELALIAALGMRHPTPLTKDQVAIISGYSSTSSSFANGLGALRSAGVIEGSSEGLRLTASGVSMASRAIAGRPQTPSALYEMWRGKLGKAERAMLDVLVAAYPSTRTKDQLASESGYSVTSSSFANALGKLRTLTLAVNDAGGVRASDELGGA